MAIFELVDDMLVDENEYLLVEEFGENQNKKINTISDQFGEKTDIQAETKTKSETKFNLKKYFMMVLEKLRLIYLLYTFLISSRRTSNKIKKSKSMNFKHN